MSTPAGAVKDSEVPDLAEDATKWREAGGNDVPGLLPQMLQMANLLDCADAVIMKELSIRMKEVQLDRVEHVSQFFAALSSFKTPKGEYDKLRKIGNDYFSALGANVDEVMEQWEVLMDWRRTREALAHHLGEHNVNPQKLAALKADVDNLPVYGEVRTAAKLMVKVVEQGLAAVLQQAAV